jgi:type VI protein secretion system component VasA
MHGKERMSEWASERTAHLIHAEKSREREREVFKLNSVEVGELQTTLMGVPWYATVDDGTERKKCADSVWHFNIHSYVISLQ